MEEYQQQFFKDLWRAALNTALANMQDLDKALKTEGNLEESKE